MAASDWVDLQQDSDTGIETIRAHFDGHAYDPHWHDTYLVGVTEQGVQQFHCRKSRHDSTPGRLVLVEPGEVHDGQAATDAGFTYSMLYLSASWLDNELRQQSHDGSSTLYPGFNSTLADDPKLVKSIYQAFEALRRQPWRIMRDTALDALVQDMLPHIGWKARQILQPHHPNVAMRARDYLHAHIEQDISLHDLASACDVDRFRLTRAFKAEYGMAPHAYLVQLRLNQARRKLAAGQLPIDIAHQLGFADQSHLGRWFRRAYGITPAQYRRRCLSH
ncbi:AraC family transcriptional regulator [Halomonas binhaiensis]|uniref:AraC family transcriptional regulator n=1 Tax=Halomonas binhaiensis TaxID=2562282 RepID=A0A5C1NE26_9GAMM|nr:AraC family transcriptional regulator [Halomonas binhaiensis]QEM81221.1 AraC family transcriptional regulator [Halomonas binhaiensis]